MSRDAGPPHVLEIDLRDPLDLLPALVPLRHPFLLHSSQTDGRSRWTFFGAEPFEVFRGRHYDHAVARWRALSARVRAGGTDAFTAPFMGGAVGYWAYDFGRRLEPLPEIARDDLNLPDFVLGLYDVVGAFDARAGRAWLVSTGMPLDGPRRDEHAARRLEFFASLFSAPRSVGGVGRPRAARAPRSTFERDGYVRAIERIQDHIARGDIFQANLSQRWTVDLASTDGAGRAAPRSPASLAHLAADLHQALAERSPAPFAAFLGAGDHAVVSASPERFLALAGRRVETRPIKGTRPRGDNEFEDHRLRAELLASAKDRAENVMIVDVLRNDLGRVCESGSVAVPELCALETFAQVHHLTSTIVGELRRDADAIDLLHACFPGGSITGAPKIRAMEILEGLEPVRRHLYTGAIGYLDWRGGADWSIAIRTALVTPTAIHFAAGGGITADSDPDAEYEETLHKAEGIQRGLTAVLGAETGTLATTRSAVPS